MKAKALDYKPVPTGLTRADMVRPKFYLARIDTRWHVYPQRQPLVAVALDYRGYWAFSKHGFWYKAPVSYNLEKEVTEERAVAHVVECVSCDPGYCKCNNI